VNLEVASLTLQLPTSSLYREGRCADVLVMEATSASCRGNRGGMFWKLNYPVLEIHHGGRETAKRKNNWGQNKIKSYYA
jgi:hypothetical protein